MWQVGVKSKYLDVAGGGHVRVDPSVGPVGSPPHLGGAVHLNINGMIG